MEKFEINALEMTRQIRDKHYEQMRGLSRAELLAFYREQARLMNEQAKKIIEAKRKLERA